MEGLTASGRLQPLNEHEEQRQLGEEAALPAATAGASTHKLFCASTPLAADTEGLALVMFPSREEIMDDLRRWHSNAQPRYLPGVEEMACSRLDTVPVLVTLRREFVPISPGAYNARDFITRRYDALGCAELPTSSLQLMTRLPERMLGRVVDAATASRSAMTALDLSRVFFCGFVEAGQCAIWHCPHCYQLIWGSSYDATTVDVTTDTIRDTLEALGSFANAA